MARSSLPRWPSSGRASQPARAAAGLTREAAKAANCLRILGAWISSLSSAISTCPSASHTVELLVGVGVGRFGGWGQCRGCPWTGA